MLSCVKISYNHFYFCEAESLNRTDPCLINNHPDAWQLKCLIQWTPYSKSVCPKTRILLKTDASFPAQDHISRSGSGWASKSVWFVSAYAVYWRNRAGKKNTLARNGTVPLVNDSGISHGRLGLSRRYLRKWRTCVWLVYIWAPLKPADDAGLPDTFGTEDGEASFYLMHNKSM